MTLNHSRTTATQCSDLPQFQAWTAFKLLLQRPQPCNTSGEDTSGYGGDANVMFIGCYREHYKSPLARSLWPHIIGQYNKCIEMLNNPLLRHAVLWDVLWHVGTSELSMRRGRNGCGWSVVSRDTAAQTCKWYSTRLRNTWDQIGITSCLQVHANFSNWD